MIRNIFRENAFKKDYKRELRGRHRDTLLSGFSKIIQMLAEDVPLDIKYKDHALVGEWKHYRDCHIRPDLVLIYKKSPGLLSLSRLGSHSQLDL